MKTFSTFLLLFLLVNISLAQTVHRVNNRTDLSVAPAGTNVYNTFAAAHAAAVNGDIIYVEASPDSYGYISVTKQLHIIGPGFKTSVNGTQQYTKTADFYRIAFSAGSANGSKLEGVKVVPDPAGASSTCYISVAASNVVIKGVYIYNNNASASGYISTEGNDITIEQCLLYNLSTVASGTYPCVYFTSGTNTVVKNNIIIREGNTNDYAFRYATGGAAVYNNTIVGLVRDVGANASFWNNIFYNGFFTGTNTGTYSNNMTFYSNPPSEATYFDWDANTPSPLSATDVFVLPSSTTTVEANWDFAGGATPAHDVGVGGVGDHLGHMGGTNPYVKAGMPNIPAIYDATVPAVGSGASINISFETKSY